jgi:transcriptional regulator with XRE-family HTH domain
LPTAKIGRSDVASANSGPLIPRRRLGAAFHQLREARGETLQQTAKALMFSPSKLSRIENGLAGEPHPRDVRDLIAHFGLTDTPDAAHLEDLAHDGRQPGWWQLAPYSMPSRVGMLIAYESAATRIAGYMPTVVPGLLQTPEYAKGVLERSAPHLSAAEVEHQVQVRMERQRRLSLREQPPRQWYVLPETILHRQVGTPATMRDQLGALLKASADPLIEFHVIPFSAGIYEAVELSTLYLFSFTPPDDDLVVIERVRYIEFMDRPGTVAKYDTVLRKLSDYWLDQDRSRAFVAEIRQEKWQEDP